MINKKQIHKPKEFQKVILPGSGMELSISEITAYEIYKSMGDEMFYKIEKLVVRKNDNPITDEDLKTINPSDAGYLSTVLSCQLSNMQDFI